VERSRFEDKTRHGSMQATCQLARTLGHMLGALCGTLLFNRTVWGWGLSFHQVLLIAGLMPVIMVIPWIIPYVNKNISIIIFNHELPATEGYVKSF
jgi:hypothetical protein